MTLSKEVRISEQSAPLKEIKSFWDHLANMDHNSEYFYNSMRELGLHPNEIQQLIQLDKQAKELPENDKI